MRAKGALPWKTAELSRKADLIGRAAGVPVLPPRERLPEVDRLVAEKTGLTERMVRKARSDRRIIGLVGLPVWEDRPWEVEALQVAWAHRQARRLCTPERLAKPITIVPACGTIGIKELIEQRLLKQKDLDRIRRTFVRKHSLLVRPVSLFRTGSELEVNGPAPPGYRGGVFNALPRERRDADKLYRRALAHWMQAKRVREAWEEDQG
jgi:hypothetical protein